MSPRLVNPPHPGHRTPQRKTSRKNEGVVFRITLKRKLSDPHKIRYQAHGVDASKADKSQSIYMIGSLFSTRKHRFRYRLWAKWWPDLDTVVTNFSWLFVAKSPQGKWVIKSVIEINFWIKVNTWHVVWTIFMELWEHLFEKRVQTCYGLIMKPHLTVEAS